MKKVGIILGPLLVIALLLLGWSWLRTDNDAPAPSTDSQPEQTTEMVPPASDASDHLPHDSAAPNEMITHTAERVVATMYTFNPSEDETPHAAMERAKMYMTGDLLKAADNPPEDTSGSATWRGWAESGDQITTSTESGPIEMHGDKEGSVTVWARQTVLGDAGTIPLSAFSVRVDLTLIDDVWLASDFEIVEGAPTI